jgi:hypothetical protein
MRHLDSASLRAVRRLLLRVNALLAAIVLTAVLFHIASFSRICGSISLAFTAASVWVGARAVARHEHPWRGAFNGWDEALTLTAIAVAARILRLVQG